jgi:hypothetical protein
MGVALNRLGTILFESGIAGASAFARAVETDPGHALVEQPRARLMERDDGGGPRRR